MNLYSFVPDANLGIKKCINGSPERNAPLLCTEVDFAFEYGYLPYPMELLAHIISRSEVIITRE